MWKLSGLGWLRRGTNSSSGAVHRDRFDDSKEKQHCQFSWGKKCFFSLKAGDAGVCLPCVELPLVFTKSDAVGCHPAPEGLAL